MYYIFFEKKKKERKMCVYFDLDMKNRYVDFIFIFIVFCNILILFIEYI